MWRDRSYLKWVAVVATAGIAGVAISLTASSQTGPSTSPSTGARTSLSKAEIILAYVPAIDIATAFVAKEEGLFESEGLNVTLKSLANGGDLLSALIGGSLDVGTAGPGSAWVAIAKGAKLKSFIAAETGSIGQVAIGEKWAKSKGITANSNPTEKINALKGATIGTNLPGGSLHAWALTFLKASGLNPDSDVKVQPLNGGSAMLAAFEAGRLDVLIHVPPTTSQAHTRDGAILLDLNDVPAMPAFREAPSDMYTTTQSFIDNHPDTVLALTRAIIRAHQFINENPKKAADDAAKYVGKLGPGFTDLDFGNIKSQGPFLTEKAYEAGIKINTPIIGDISGLSYTKVIDPSFQKKAAEQLKIPYPR
jgi:NitT/TauT family transport system substrate-binding protein